MQHSEAEAEPEPQPEPEQQKHVVKGGPVKNKRPAQQSQGVRFDAQQTEQGPLVQRQAQPMVQKQQKEAQVQQRQQNPVQQYPVQQQQQQQFPVQQPQQQQPIQRYEDTPRAEGYRTTAIRESRIKDRPVKKDAKASAMSIKIELDLEVEVDLYARVKGDVTIGLM